MILIIKLSILTTIWVLGLTIATQEGMIFHSIRKRAEDRGEMIFEPLILCHWCMPSLHAVMGYLFAMAIGLLDFRVSLILIYPLVVMLSSLMCGLIWQGYKLMEVLYKYYDHMETLAFWEVKEGKANYHNRKNSIQNGTEKKSAKRYKKPINTEKFA